MTQRKPRPRISKFAKLTKKFNPRRGGVHPVSEAHRKELNVLTSYRLNDFKKKASATHVDMSANIRRAAFTLAEVLITLGIIGIVAAMTIPTLIANYKDKALESQFKKSYSLFSQVLTGIQGDFGYIPSCYYIEGGANSANKTSECPEFQERFLNKLKISRICDGDAFEKGCIPEYNGVDTALKDKHKDDEDYDEEYWQDYANANCYGFTKTVILNNKKVYALADGTILFFWSDTVNLLPAFVVDINGKVGPNKWGHDLFAYVVYSDREKLVLKGGGCMSPEDGGLFTQEMINKIFH